MLNLQIMRKRLILWTFAAAALLLAASSCDFIRQVAGRPTAAQVEQIRRDRLAAEEARHQARLDSLRRVQQQLADSLAALDARLLDSLSHARGTILNPSRLGGIAATTPEAKYSIVVGAFRNLPYAQRKQKSCEEAGYPATVVRFRNGLHAVAVCPSDTLHVVVASLKELREKGICPQEGWILMNE